VRRLPPLLLSILLVVVLAPAAASARRGGPRGGGERGTLRGSLLLDGERVAVRWNDGDSFRIDGGRHAGRRARLAGVNALEGHGPVHRIGPAGGAELLGVARRARSLAAGNEWRCTVARGTGGYGRLLVSCPDAAGVLVSAGLAMVFAVDAPAAPALLAAQRTAQKARLGMWARGAPPLVPASAHSADERGLGRGGAYDRVVDTRTGSAERRSHARRYAVCEEVCVGEGAERACLTYVPYERHHRDRPACLR
jgi:endonuclease YncB( thermonuclease family)